MCFFAKMCLVAPSERIFDNHQLWKAPSLEQQILRHLSNEKNPLTPAKTNVEPENDGLEDAFPLPGVYSEVRC